MGCFGVLYWTRCILRSLTSFHLELCLVYHRSSVHVSLVVALGAAFDTSNLRLLSARQLSSHMALIISMFYLLALA